MARALRAALLRHRDGARVFAGTHSTGGNTLGFAEALIDALREAGFGASDAARAMLAVVNFTLGHTLEEQAALAGEAPADPERLRLAVTESAFPHLAAAVPVITEGDFEAHFDSACDSSSTACAPWRSDRPAGTPGATGAPAQPQNGPGPPSPTPHARPTALRA
ncbi:TetR/AcrR family transcriptional regulator C-terminal domain-containing protein [Streptomyces roseus]|uniref:TetR/AcrR family transcriptional regulator C-terminal domain-containing protein n=1 Tax=Streptomyces roseus TaxID=66430 RepID=UPI003CC91D39